MKGSQDNKQCWQIIVTMTICHSDWQLENSSRFGRMLAQLLGKYYHSNTTTPTDITVRSYYGNDNQLSGCYGNAGATLRKYKCIELLITNMLVARCYNEVQLDKWLLWKRNDYFPYSLCSWYTPAWPRQFFLCCFSCRSRTGCVEVNRYACWSEWTQFDFYSCLVFQAFLFLSQESCQRSPSTRSARLWWVGHKDGFVFGGNLKGTLV